MEIQVHTYGDEVALKFIEEGEDIGELRLSPGDVRELTTLSSEGSEGIVQDGRGNHLRLLILQTAPISLLAELVLNGHRYAWMMSDDFLRDLAGGLS